MNHEGIDSNPLKLTPRQSEILDLLRRPDPTGLIRYELPVGMAVWLPNVIFQLRGMGYQILTLREPVGNTWVGRYVLIDEPEG